MHRRRHRIFTDDPSDHVVDVKFMDFLMVLNGVVILEPWNGRTGAQRYGLHIRCRNIFIRLIARKTGK